MQLRDTPPHARASNTYVAQPLPRKLPRSIWTITYVDDDLRHRPASRREALLPAH